MLPQIQSVEWRAQLQTGALHLASVDPVLAPIIERVGPCGIVPAADVFRAIVNAIVGQQISTTVARAIRGRLDALAGGEMTAERLLTLDDASLRGVGLSSAKVRYIRDLSERAADGRVKVNALPLMPDSEVLSHLIEVKGIGRWTAEMVLIFSLGRLDVLPVDDLGLRTAFRNQYGPPELPERAAIEAHGERWRPFRSIATWYLWRSLENQPL